VLLAIHSHVLTTAQYIKTLEYVSAPEEEVWSMLTQPPLQVCTEDEVRV